MILIKNKLYRKILYSFFYCLSLISIAFIYGCSVTKKLNIDGHEGHIRTGSLQPDSGEETDLSPSVRECINELIINDNLEKYFNNDFFDENKGFVNDLIGSCTKADDGNSFLPTPVWVYRPAITWIYALSVCVNSVSTQAIFSSGRGSNDLPSCYTKDSDKRLKQKRNPYQHTENKHIPEKSSKCEICNKVFRLTYEFKRHQVVHSNKRHHKCSYCNKDYKRKDHLKKHTDKKHPNALS